MATTMRKTKGIVVCLSFLLVLGIIIAMPSAIVHGQHAGGGTGARCPGMTS